MKKHILGTASAFLIAILLILPSCSAVKPYKQGSGNLKIVASSFIAFDFARNVTGERAEITVLQTDGGDLHDYTPTVAALDALAEADIFICIGGVSDDSWISGAVASSGNKNLTVIELTELVHGALAETEGHSESAACKQSHNHKHEHEHSADDGHGHTADEHIWTSPKNAITAVRKITEVCMAKDAENASLYEASSAGYITALQALDAEYTVAAAAAKAQALVFADSFPFVYLTRDYGICYFAAFSGCSGELDADFETAIRLTEAVKHNALRYVIVTESSDKKLAKSIADATGCEILTLDSMQSVSRSEIESGAAYLETMKANLATLKIALS